MHSKTPLNKQVDFRKVAEHMGVKRSSLRMATQKEALGITGFRIGTIPPLGRIRRFGAQPEPSAVSIMPEGKSHELVISAPLPDQSQQAAGTPGWRERDVGLHA